MQKQQLQHCIGRLSQGRVLVVGDVAIDEMIYGETSRLSREAPVIILHHNKTDILLGAAGNAAHNLAALGTQKVTMVGLAGKDYYASLLFEAMTRDGISLDGMIQDETRPTITKTRISGAARQSVMQQIVRIDRESKLPVSPEIEQKLLDTLEALAPHHDALIVSDYNLGVVSPRMIEACRAVALKHNLVWSVDSHQPLTLFKGATVATPNLPEAEENLGSPLTSPERVMMGGRTLKSQAQLKNLLITRGCDGMTLFAEDARMIHIPVFNRSEVFDVTGAGDTVIATLTLALATGASMLEAAVLGNLAASIVVKKYATATTNPAEMLATLEELNPDLLNIDPVTVSGQELAFLPEAKARPVREP